jgi:hypothetical protein
VAKEASTSTIPTPPSLDKLKRGRALRRLFMVALGGVLIAGALGFLGVRTAEKTGSGGGYEVAVTYASITRPGLATAFDIEVTHAGGFTDQVVVAVNGDYLAVFDENGLDPDPAKTRSDDRFTYWTFDPPPGDVLSVSFDARLEPGVQWKKDGTVLLLDAKDKPLAQVDFTTWVVP